MIIKKISARATKELHGSLLFIFILVMTTSLSENVSAQENNQLVRLAKLQIDSAQLENYKAALKEEIETSLRIEAGVLTLYAVSEKDHPTHITILEIYADTNAYKSHIQTPHFIKYKTTTKEMVKSLELLETIPIVPGVKMKTK
jgi:4-carboxymuconolactone decarboxylase